MSLDFVFLHGGGQGGWVWDETIAALHLQWDHPQSAHRQSAGQASGAVRALAVDAPGCGAKRGRDTSDIAFDDITAEFLADIEAAGMRDAILVGHSQAGCNLPRLAAAAPRLFRRLVYVSCIAPDPGLTVVEMTGERIHGKVDGGKAQGASAHPFLDANLSVADRYKAMFCNDMTPSEADAFIAKLGKDGWPPCCYAETDWRYDHLDAIPASYVLCLADAILPLAWQERFAEQVRATRRVHIDAGHQVMNTRPHALAEALLVEARAAAD